MTPYIIRKTIEFAQMDVFSIDDGQDNVLGTNKIMLQM